VSDATLHIDFLQVLENKPIRVSIPVKLEGLAEGVKQGGKLQLINRKLKVKALAKDLPDYLIVNVDNINLGQSVKVGTLHYENIELLDDKNVVIAAVKLTRASKGTPEEEAAAATTAAPAAK